MNDDDMITKRDIPHLTDSGEIMPEPNQYETLLEYLNLSAVEYLMGRGDFSPKFHKLLNSVGITEDTPDIPQLFKQNIPEYLDIRNKIGICIKAAFTLRSQNSINFKQSLESFIVFIHDHAIVRLDENDLGKYLVVQERIAEMFIRNFFHRNQLKLKNSKWIESDSKDHE